MSVEEQSISRPVKDFFDNLSRAIKKGHFTPFLGAGASSLREKRKNVDTAPWNQIMKTIVAIWSQLQTERGQLFIRSFAAQRLRLTEAMLNKELPSPSPGKQRKERPGRIDPRLQNNSLLRLQVELVLATVRLTDYFGTRFSQETPAIHDLASCSVPFSPRIQEGDDAVKQLLKAAEVARWLQSEPPEKRESPFLESFPEYRRELEIKPIYEKLLTLTVILLGNNRKAYDKDLKRHEVGADLPIPAELWSDGTGDIGRLRLDAVQWMSELVWYTLRYWIPCYPTTAELAFELSLKVTNAPPRRAELAQAAQALENQLEDTDSDLCDEMAQLIGYCEEYQKKLPESGRSVKAFYYAIAAAMEQQYDLFLKRSNPDPAARYKDGGGDKQSDEPQPTVSIVFTTNFDNALENVFKECHIGYHVIYPTLSTTRKNEKPVWWVRTCPPKPPRAPVPDEKWLEMEMTEAAQPSSNWLIGPIIIKIHGAPCLQTPDRKHKHWLVLSEAGYLQALASAGNLPDWFSEQLGAGTESYRSLWFLGYSISDWNVRLRLFEHCKEGNKGFRSAVDREADVYKTALLLDETIKVEPWVADLELLPRRLLHMFNNQDLSQLPRVRLLVDKLTKTLASGE